MDGDGYLGILVGDALIGEAKPDHLYLMDEVSDLRLSTQTPEKWFTIWPIFQYKIVNTDEPVDAVLLVNGVEVKHTTSEPD